MAFFLIVYIFCCFFSNIFFSSRFLCSSVISYLFCYFLLFSSFLLPFPSFSFCSRLLSPLPSLFSPLLFSFLFLSSLLFSSLFFSSLPFSYLIFSSLVSSSLVLNTCTRVSGFPNFCISEFLNFWISEFLNFWISEFLYIWICTFERHGSECWCSYCYSRTKLILLWFGHTFLIKGAFFVCIPPTCNIGKET